MRGDSCSPRARAPIVCLEGPSAVGKTTLARALAAAYGAAVVSELDATGAPPPERAEPWFTDHHAERWGRAVDAGAGPDAQPAPRDASGRGAGSVPFVVMDGDPLKGVWYNWMHAAEGWPGADVVAPLYRARLEGGTLGIPDLYVVLGAPEADLRARRAGDATRSRRGFEKHVRTAGAQRRYFTALGAAFPGLVAVLDTADRAALAGRVHALVAALPVARPDPLAILDVMARWVRTHAPAD